MSTTFKRRSVSLANSVRLLAAARLSLVRSE